jgi:prepilin-type N-terminal cleavage/methylation domain-containing protein
VSAHKNSAGFSLVEILVSLSITSIAMLAVGNAIATHIWFNTRSEQRSGAILAAQQVLDPLRLVDPSTLPTSGTSSTTVTIGALNYTVTTTYCPTGQSYCTSNNIRYMTTKVVLNGTQFLSLDTAFSQLR